MIAHKRMSHRGRLFPEVIYTPISRIILRVLFGNFQDQGMEEQIVFKIIFTSKYGWHFKKKILRQCRMNFFSFLACETSFRNVKCNRELYNTLGQNRS